MNGGTGLGRSMRAGSGPALLLLLAALWFAYAPALPGPFQFDDWWAIVGNPAVHSLAEWWRGLPGIRPLLKFANALNWTLDPTPSAFRATNLAIHGLNALLVFALALRLHQRLGGDPGRRHLVALATAAIFAFHPAATEAVSYISGRSVSLMATPYLIASWLVLGVDRETTGTATWSTLLFAIALCVRETAITLPFALLGVVALHRGAWHPPGRTLALQVACAVVLAMIALHLPGYPGFFAAGLGSREVADQWQGQVSAHHWLVFHTLLGLNTNIDPDVPERLDVRQALTFATLTLAAVGLAWQSRHRRPWWLFGIGWYALHLAPTNSLVPRFDLANDRHLYLAVIGPALAVAWELSERSWRRTANALLLGLWMLLLVHTWQRNFDYRSELALWRATVRDSPEKARPWVNLGVAWEAAGQADQAERAYRCAIWRDPSFATARTNLAALRAGPVPTTPPSPGCDAP